MTRPADARSAFLLFITCAAFLLAASAASANTAYFSGEPLAHPYISANDHVFVALEDVAEPLGLSVVFDGERLLVGGTVHGTLSVDPTSHTLDVGEDIVDYREPLFQRDELWYVPDGFLKHALGVEACLDAEAEELLLFPVVVAITPAEGKVRITSSLPPDYRTFELDAPPRRVIDISGAFLRGRFLTVPGSILGVTGIAVLRASQFSVEPPTVRVVLEWDADDPPAHTVFSESRSLAVLIGSVTPAACRYEGRNLLAIEFPSDEPAPAVTPPETGNGTLEPDPPPDAGIPPSGPNLPEEIDLPSPSPAELPEDAENLPLDLLGWQIAFDMDPDGFLTATLNTPPFNDLSEFTLGSDSGMRLVLDIEGAFLPGDERRVEGLGDVAQVRFAQFEPGITRVVFDCTRAVAYETEIDPSIGRIVVKLLGGELSGKTIVIDPGHGGEDPGAVVHGVMEKDLNLDMAFALRDFLAEHGARVVLTRETDVYVTLARRIEIAEREDADLFICIHNNTTEEPTAIQGALILYKDKDGDRMRLYRQAHRGIAHRTNIVGLGPVEDERGLYILRHADDMPVLFVEAAFMTNPLDFARLTDSSGAYAENIMLGVMDGVLAWYSDRDLPPVPVPDYGEDAASGIFDLTGRPLVVPDDEGDSGDPPEVSGGDDCPEDETEEEPGEDEGEDQDDDGGDDDDDYHRTRGRGAYRHP